MRAARLKKRKSDIALRPKMPVGKPAWGQLLLPLFGVWTYFCGAGLLACQDYQSAQRAQRAAEVLNALRRPLAGARAMAAIDVAALDIHWS